MNDIKQLQEENTRLRAALAMSDRPCAYCSLPAEEWAKCQLGFPGCDRADDAMGCPHLGASLVVLDLKAEIERLREAEHAALEAAGWRKIGPDEVVVPREPTQEKARAE